MLQANVVETATATSMASHQATLAIKNAAEAIVASGEAEVTGTVAAEMHDRELEAALAESSCMYVTEEVEHEVETAAQLKASEVRMAELIFVHTSESARLKGELWLCGRAKGHVRRRRRTRRSEAGCGDGGSRCIRRSMEHVSIPKMDSSRRRRLRQRRRRRHLKH